MDKNRIFLFMLFVEFAIISSGCCDGLKISLSKIPQENLNKNAELNRE